jgi:hypothetical protein
MKYQAAIDCKEGPAFAKALFLGDHFLQSGLRYEKHTHNEKGV